MNLLTSEIVQPVPQKTFFDNVAPSLTLPLFTVSLNHLNPGSYDFGFIDPDKYYGPLTYFPAITPSAGLGWWLVNATGFSVGCQGTFIPFPGGQATVVDSGTTFLLLHQEYCDIYYAEAPFVVNDPVYGYIYPCAEILPDLTLSFGRYEAVIPGFLMQGANLNDTSTLIPFSALDFRLAN
jgi:aspergillopepsin I